MNKTGFYIWTFLFVSIIAFVLTLPVFSDPLPTMHQIQLANQKTFSIDVSSLLSYYDKLSPDEKDEQLRDWALYGILTGIELSNSTLAKVFKGNSPMRFSDKKNFTDDISPGRVADINPLECVVVVSQSEINNTLLIGSLFDKQRINFEPAAESVHIFGYNLEDGSSTLKVTYSRTLPGKNIFTEQFGYYEKEIKTLDDFNNFVNNTGYTGYMKWKSGKIILGGRKNAAGKNASLSAEDIAALYRAYMPKNSHPGEDSNVGFSLDPNQDCRGIADDIAKVLIKDAAFVSPEDKGLSVAIDSNTAALNLTKDKLRNKQYIAPLIRLMKRLHDSPEADNQRLSGLLQFIELEHSFQQARYDGNLKGTTPGMILFYTDLTAKLWALNYNNLAPEGKVKGFRTMPEIKVPRIFWNDFIKLSKTRLWFGIRNESFDIKGTELVFEPIATRVYAASSSPLEPGRESKPNYQSAQFLGWWDRHFASLADYEPYYYKLNELQKWGVILMLLKEENIRALDFLYSVPVKNDRNFMEWYSSEELINKSVLPVVDGKKFNINTECFNLLRSGDYPLMGQSFFLSGGVTLASKKDILAKLKKTKPATTSVSKGAGKTKHAAIETKVKQAKAEPASFKKTKYGNFSARKQNDTVYLSWSKGSGEILDESINYFVGYQEDKKSGYKSETVFATLPGIKRLLRVEAGKTYLLKTESLKDNWMYVRVNEPEKSAAYPSKGSGTGPDCDIFYARLITNDQAEKIKAESVIYMP